MCRDGSSPAHERVLKGAGEVAQWVKGHSLCESEPWSSGPSTTQMLAGNDSRPVTPAHRRRRPRIPRASWPARSGKYVSSGLIERPCLNTGWRSIEEEVQCQSWLLILTAHTCMCACTHIYAHSYINTHILACEHTQTYMSKK